MKKIFVLATIMLLSTKIMAQTLERMQWFNEPENWEIKDGVLTMNVTDAVEIFYSFDDKEYTMMRNCWMQDNTPVMVGMMAASPDGEGFKAKFEHFQIKHLPDQRRLEWLEKHK